MSTETAPADVIVVFPTETVTLVRCRVVPTFGFAKHVRVCVVALPDCGCKFVVPNDRGMAARLSWR